MDIRDTLPEFLTPELWVDAYSELKKIASARLYSAGPLTQLNTTALVNESYLKLVARIGELSFESRGHFFSYSSKVMRSIIVDLVRERNAQRHGGDFRRVTLSDTLGESIASDEELLQVDEALSALEKVEPRLAQVVEMSYFAGMTQDEIAHALGITGRTVRRDWDKARVILRSMLS